MTPEHHVLKQIWQYNHGLDLRQTNCVGCVLVYHMNWV